MVGIVFNISGIDCSANAVGYAAPNTRGLTGLFLLGTALQQSLRNLLAGGVAATALLAPTPGAGYAAFSAALGQFVTPISDSPSMTMIFAARVPVMPTNNATGVYYGGNYKGGGGVGLYTNANTPVSVIGNLSFTPTGGGTAVAKIPQVSLSGINLWNFFALVIDGVGLTCQMFNLTTGVSGTQLATGGQLLQNPSNPLYIGGIPATTSSFFGAEVDIALAEFHNVALSLTELQAIYAGFKAPLANRGIAV